MNVLSLHHLTMLSAHPLELISAAEAGGFEYCGLRLIAPMEGDPVVDVPGNPALVRDLQRRLETTGVGLLDIEAIWLQPRTDVRELEPALEVGRRLGAHHVLSVGFDDDKSRLLDNFCALCVLAARYDMDVDLEFISYCSIATLDQAMALIDAGRQPNARLLVDTLQFFRSGASPADLEKVSPEKIAYMQLCDGMRIAPQSIDERRREARTARMLPGEGELPVDALLRQMPDDIPLSVEAPTLKLAGRPYDEQARIIGAVTRRFLERQSS